MPGRAQVSDGTATHGHCRATGRQPYTEHKGKLCVLLENKLHLQDVSSETSGLQSMCKGGAGRRVEYFWETQGPLMRMLDKR